MSKLVSIQSENLFGPNIFDIVGNAFVGGIEHAHLLETPGAQGLTPPVGNLGPNVLGSAAGSNIMTDQEIKFIFHWGVKGAFAHVVNPAFEWRIAIYMEKYGPDEFDLHATTFGYRTVKWSTGIFSALDQVNFGLGNTSTITIPPNTIPPGLYDVVAVIQLYDGPAATDLPCFSAAFAEFNKINFYKEHI